MNEQKKRISASRRLLLWALSEKPMTTNQAAEFLKCSQSGVVSMLRDLQNRGLVYVSGSMRTDGRPAPIYATHTKHEKPPQKSVKCGMSAFGREEIEKILKELGPMTTEELSQFVGLPQYRVAGVISYHRKGGRSTAVFRVAQWSWRDRKGWMPAYGIGTAPDAPKPKRDIAENRRRHASRVKAQKRVLSSTLAGNPFAELIHVAGATLNAVSVQREARRAA